MTGVISAHTPNYDTITLNIQDYTLIELKDLLNIVEPYTLEDIVNNENE